MKGSARLYPEEAVPVCLDHPASSVPLPSDWSTASGWRPMYRTRFADCDIQWFLN